MSRHRLEKPDATTVLTRRRLLRDAAAAGFSLSALTTLAACGGATDAATSPSESTAATTAVAESSGPAALQEATIKLGLFAHSPDAPKWFKEYNDQFHAQHPNITVTELFYDVRSYYEALSASYASPNPPDLNYLLNVTFPLYADRGVLRPIDDLVSDPAWASEYDAIPPSIWELAKYEGKTWGVPILGAVHATFVNLDLLGSVGADDWARSYESMRAAAKAVTSGNVYGFGIPTSPNDFAYNFFAPFIFNAGGTLFNKDYTASGLDTPDVGQALQLLQDMHRIDKSAPEPGLYDAKGLAALFAAGRLAIAQIDAAYVLPELTKNSEFEWAVSVLPRGPKAQTCYGDFGFIVMASAADVPAAWEFTRYLASREWVIDYLGPDKLAAVLVSTRTDVGADIAAANGDPYFYGVAQNDLIPLAHGWQGHAKTPDALRALTSAFESCMRGDVSGAEAVAQADAMIADLLAS